MEPKKEILTVSEAAGICNVTRATMWRWIKSGKLPSAATAGGHYRIHMNDLRALLRSSDMETRIRTETGGRRILVVDDDPGIRKMLCRALDKGGYTVDWAANGFEAGVKTVRFHPDLIILDLFMPEMDGFEVCRRLKGDPDTAHTKIIAVSGFDTEENRRKVIDRGADLFIPKPVDLRRLKRKITDMLS